MADSINERLAVLLHAKNLTKTKFAMEMGVSVQAISGWTSTTSLGIKPITKILEYFPDLNARWLLFGVGKMTIEEEDYCPIRADFLKTIQSWNNMLTDQLHEKDKLISELQQQINTLINSKLDELSKYDKG